MNRPFGMLAELTYACPLHCPYCSNPLNLADYREELTTAEWGFSPPGPGIDHVLVRGADVSEHHRWPLDRRRVDGRLLSDHAPVEVALP